MSFVLRSSPSSGGASADERSRFHLPVPFLRDSIPAGDAAARATSAVGIQPCTPCEKRKQYLNSLLVFTPWGDQ